MFGIMGMSAAFANAASNKKAKYITILESIEENPSYVLSCVGEITIESVFNGEKIMQTYSNLNEVETSIQSDENSPITIYGELTEVSCQENGTKFVDITKNGAIIKVECLDCNVNEFLSENNKNIETIILSGNPLTEIDFSTNTSLKNLEIQEGYLQKITIGNSIQDLKITGQQNLVSISYPATNGDVSTAIAGAITAATAADGTVYTDSAAAYYSTIETAATAKGWTIEQIA